jgi:PAS domain S-box-containing protein
MHIMVVEDDEDSRILQVNILESMGYRVTSAGNGKAALEMIKRAPPDLIISDILMPEMDGFGLCQALKGDEKLRSIPIVFYTATYTDPKDEQLALEMGASRFLVKPVEPKEFLKEIEQVLEEYKSKKLPLRESPLKPPLELDHAHAEALGRKLDKKIIELEDEHQKLLASEQRYRRLVEALREDYFFYTQNPDGIFSYISPSITIVLGYSQEEFLVHYTEYLTDNPINKEVIHHTELSIKGEKQPSYEVEICHKDGSTRYLEVTEEPVFDKDGSVIAVEGIAHDITNRRAAEEELKKTKESLQRAQQIAHLGNWDWNIVTNEFWCSDEIHNIFGLSPQAADITYEVFIDFVHADDRPFLRQAVDGALSGKQPYSIDHRIVLPDETERFVHAQAEVIVDEYTGKPIRMVGTLQDISERKRMEDEKTSLMAKLRQAQKMEAIGTLAGGIAHDFNNLLTPITGYAEMALESLPAGSLDRAHQQQVINAAKRARDLVNQILTFSRQTEQEKRPVQLHSITKEALKLLRSSIPSTIEIHQNIPSDSGAVLADPTQLQQVLLNLCTNAYHAMREGGGVLGISVSKVEVASDDYVTNLGISPGKYLRVEISDTGCGMDKDTQERIFDPYFTTKEKGEGTGLGLAVVHGIVKNHGGHITVYSEPGKGSIFHIYFPVLPVDPTSVGSETSESPPRGTENIMLVEDEKEILRMEETMLDRLGYRVQTYSNGEEALAAFQKSYMDFDLVITDMTMPKMTGAELAQKVLAIRSDIPIILCSGFNEIINEKKAKAIGIREYVMKPLTLRDFAGTIRSVLDED